MTYTTILTSKGTTTIPAKIRRSLGLTPGMRISFTQDTPNGEYVIRKTPTIADVRAMNRKAMIAAGTLDKDYTAGDGFAAQADYEMGLE